MNLYFVPFGFLNARLPQITITAEFVSTIIYRKRGRFYPALRRRNGRLM